MSDYTSTLVSLGAVRKMNTDYHETPFSLEIRLNEYSLQLSTKYGTDVTDNSTSFDPLSQSECPNFNTLLENYQGSGWRPANDINDFLTSSRLGLDKSLSKHRKEADCLVNHMKELSSTLLDTLKQITHIETHIALCGSFASLIWRLPSETLSEIFEHCTQTTTGRDITLAPLNLRRVCKHWNSIISSQRTAWNRLRIDIGHGQVPLDDIRRLEQVIDCHHSGWKADVPRSVGLFIDGYGPASDSIMGLLKHRLKNCRRLYFGSTKLKWLYELVRSGAMGAPNLEFIYLNFVRVRDWIPLPDTPNLRDAEVIIWTQNYCKLNKQYIPFSQLTRLSTTFLISRSSEWIHPVEGWIYNTMRCPNLEVLEVSFKNISSDWRDCRLNTHVSADYCSVTLPKIRKLVFATDFPGVFTDFIQHLLFPNLTHLIIDGYHPFYLVSSTRLLDDALTGELAFFSGLVELELVRACLSEDQVRAILETTARLEKFTLMNYHRSTQWYDYGPIILHDDFVFDLLAAYTDDPLHLPLVPHLSELHLFRQLTGPYAHWAAQYGALAKSRNAYLKERKPSSAFRIHLTVEVFPYPNQTVLKHLNKFSDALREDGVAHLVTFAESGASSVQERDRRNYDLAREY